MQELLECDTSFNRGCNGGNPTLAYKYILDHGLAADASWPYRGQDATCPFDPAATHEDRDSPGVTRESTASPVAVGGIESYVVLPSRNEAWMRHYLGTVGPVSVGICGTDVQFMFYGGGIFNPKDCCTTLNHAVLVVGYGECNIWKLSLASLLLLRGVIVVRV